MDLPIYFEAPKRLTSVNSWHGHIPFALFLMDALRPGIFVELGTHRGDSYCAFCQAAQELKLNAACFAVDTWKGDDHSGFYGPEVLQDLRAYHDPLYGSFSRLLQCTFDEALHHFADGTISLLHIDGCHTYEVVKHDFESWLPKMSARGIILLHDINVREREFGVWRLWSELRQKYPHFEFLHGHGLGVLGAGNNIPKALREIFEASGEKAANIQNFFFNLGRRTAEQAAMILELQRMRALQDANRPARAAATFQPGQEEGAGPHKIGHAPKTESVKSGGSIKRLFVVLGTHRSGTSAITRALQVLGVELGDRLMPAAKNNNEKGFWEDLDVNLLNEELLSAIGHNWHNLALISGDELVRDTLKPFHMRAVELLRQKIKATDTFGMKDPRFARLLPFWKSVFQHLEYDVNYVIAIRNPLSVVRSLQARDNFPSEKSYYQWLEHMVPIMLETASSRRVVVDYDLMMDNPAHEIGRIAHALGLEQLDPARLEEFRSDFLDAGLRHTRYSAKDIQLDLAAPPQILPTFEMFSRLATDDLPIDSPEVLSHFEKVSIQLDEMGPAFRYLVWQEDLLVGERQQNAALTQSRDELQRRVSEVESHASQMREEMAALRGESVLVRGKLNQQVAELNQTIGLHQERMAALRGESDLLRRELNQQVAELNQTIGLNQGRMAALSQTIAERDGQLANLNRTLMEREAQLNDANQLLAGSRKEFDALKSSKSAGEAQAGARVEQLHQELACARQTLATIQGGMSWRATGVLRRAFSGHPRARKWTRRLLLLAWWTVTAQLGTRLRERRRFFKRRRVIAASPLFDGPWYLEHNPDVAAGGWDPALHYALFGATERRNPGPRFDATWYLNQYADVASSGVNPLVHFLEFGEAEGREKRDVSESGSEANAPPSAISAQEEEALAAAGDYGTWIKRYDLIGDEDEAAIRNHISTLRETPLISVLMPVYNPPPLLLRKALDSVIAQLYPYWELCIADDASSDPAVKSILDEYARCDRRIKVVYRRENGHIAAASNSALELVGGDFVALMDHDDELAPHALYMVAEKLNVNPKLDLIFSDEDKIDENGRRYEPWFKTDWNYDFMLSQNTVVHLAVYRSSILRHIGGFRPGFDGSQDYDLTLRFVECTKPARIAHIPFILYHWRAIPGSVALSSGEKSYAYQAAAKAIQEHLDRIHSGASVSLEPHQGYYRVRWPLPPEPPLVSIIVPTRDNLPLLKQTVDSILGKTEYKNFELIVVDNRSDQPDTLSYLKEISRTARVRVIKYDRPFNFSALNNWAVGQTDAPLLAFVNNDVEAITPGWLSEMVSHALRTEVGAVGAKLSYPNDTIQHAGVVVGIGGLAGHPHIGFSREDLGYFGRAACTQQFSAVTAACMVMRREVFAQIGGFDDAEFAVAFNDVDIGLRLNQAGYSVVWTPYAELYHHESASLGPPSSNARKDLFEKECANLKRRWVEVMEHDPFYNPNLTITQGDFKPAFPPRVRKPWKLWAAGSGGKMFGHFQKGSKDVQSQAAWDKIGHDLMKKFLVGNGRLRFPKFEEPDLSILLLFCNNAHLSLLCLQSLLANSDVSYEVVIVDNGSTDETAQLLERIRGATIVRNKENLRFIEGCRQAAEHSRGRFLCFFNNDALLMPHSLSAALGNFRENPKVGAVGGKILLSDGRLQEAGTMLWSDGTALGYGRGNNPDLPEYQFRREVDYCSGAFLFTPRQLFLDLGAFDPIFYPAYYEDTDYCMRVWQKGLKVIYEPRAVIRHYESAWWKNEAAQTLMTTNCNKFVEKWRDTLSSHLPSRDQNITAARISTHCKGLRILFIEDRVPHLHMGAGYPRSNKIIRHLAEQGHVVTCVTFVHPPDGNEYSDIPHDVELFDGVREQEKLFKNYLPNCDLIWVSRPHNMAAFLKYRDKHRSNNFHGKVVYDAEAIFAERDLLRARVTGQSVSPKQMRTWKATEMALAKAADCVVVVSPRDRVTMASAGVSNIHIIGHQVAPHPTRAPFELRKTFLFVGAMHGSDNPNADSMRYFCDQAWPQLHLTTDAELMIAGFGTTVIGTELKLSGIQILGKVDNLKILYEQARVFVIPTRYAAGIPIKAYEAAAHGVPMVVSTLIGQQLGWEHDQDCLIADGPIEFTECCSRLYRDEELWNRLRTNSLKKVEDEQSLKTFADAIDRVLKSAS